MQRTTVFQQHNLPGLWTHAGVGATIRFVPLHKLFKAVGNQLCAVLTALHRITGYDITSGVGTKKATKY